MYGLIEVELELSPKLESLGDASQFIDAVFEAVDSIPIFGDFVYEEIKLLAGYMQCFGAPANEEILSEGDDGDYLLLLLTGAVKVLKSDPASQKSRKLIAMVGPGTTLGEMSLIDGERRCATCITITPTDFALMRRSDLHRLINDMPLIGNRFMMALLQLMTRRLRNTSSKLAIHAPPDITADIT